MKNYTYFLTAGFLLIAVINLSHKPSQARIAKKIQQTKQYHRFQWFNQQRAYPNSMIPKEYYLKIVESEQSKIKGKLRKTAQLNWKCIGPYGAESDNHWGTVSGRVRALAIHPTDPLTVYMGAASGGIWKTTNGGTSWDDIGRDLASLTYGAIAIDPMHPDTVYAGSGEAIYFALPNHTEDSRGLYKSVNGGQTWMQITDGFGVNTIFADLEVSPYNSDVVIGALASGGLFRYKADFPNEGIWKSSNAGINWTRVLDVQDAYDILFHPSDSSIVYAAIGGADSVSGFYISMNQGETWTQSNAGLPAGNEISRMQIDISRSDPDILYAVIYSEGDALYNGESRAFKSIDQGKNWTQISAGVPLGGYNPQGFWADQGFYDLCIAIDPVNPDHVFIGNQELHETTNGKDFSPRRTGGNDATNSIAHMDYHKLVFSFSDPSYFYIGCDGGVYKSENSGQTISSANTGLNTFQFYRIAHHPTNPSIIIGGTQDNGFNITSDGGSTWETKVLVDGMDCFFCYDNPDYCFFASQFGNIWRSTNGGESFSWVYAPNNAVFETPFFQHPTKPLYLYTAGTSIYRSTNRGISFSILSQNASPKPIWTMAQSKVNPNYMIFGTGNDIPFTDSTFYVRISKDEGKTWTDVSANIPGEQRWISKVATDPVNDSTMYILRTGFSENNKVYKTTNLGQSWTNITGDLPDLPCSDIFVWPYNTDSIFIATDLGIYLTANGGSNWIYASERIPYVSCIDMDFVKKDSVGYLRVATYGRSIYETQFDIYVNIEDDKSKNVLPNTFNLYQNYPNPFNPKTVIRYDLPVTCHLVLSIYNTLGQKVATLVNKKEQAGVYQVEWDASGFSSGVYFYRLETDQSFTQIRKLIVLK